MEKINTSHTTSETYQLFASQVAQLKFNINSQSDLYWKYYDFGPKDKNLTPLIFLPSTTGTAESYYLQIYHLGMKGYRVISVQYPPYMDHFAWTKSFDRFIDSLKVDKVHLFGASLGGYLAQCYTEYRPIRVKSIILCNSFCDNEYYANRAPCLSLLPWMPDFMIRKLVLSNLPQETERDSSIMYMIEQMQSLSSEELISRIMLNYKQGPLVAEDLPLDNEAITIMDTMDGSLIPDQLKNEVHKFYPGAKEALLKAGGDFPFLSQAEEINMYIEVHLRANGYPITKSSEK